MDCDFCIPEDQKGAGNNHLDNDASQHHNSQAGDHVMSQNTKLGLGMEWPYWGQPAPLLLKWSLPCKDLHNVTWQRGWGWGRCLAGERAVRALSAMPWSIGTSSYLTWLRMEGLHGGGILHIIQSLGCRLCSEEVSVVSFPSGGFPEENVAFHPFPKKTGLLFSFSSDTTLAIRSQF